MLFMLNTEVLIKVKEEELEDSYLIVKIPFWRSNKRFRKDFAMGVKYAQCGFYDDNRDEYDKYFDTMASIRDGIDGEQAFMFYMEKLGYKVIPIIPDYEFE